ncbi:sensor histidine kinase KdpD [Schaalia sp. 19OD2882]|uniref:sensor histidine kinase n=1 Tax=Schaalia sp. 19OD2882 TaxID=2794089 RepID=UPI0020A7E153|nr:HAMP domain-containing sensor histidine kinase [Schaalia sp. 19OD2882]
MRAARARRGGAVWVWVAIGLAVALALACGYAVHTRHDLQRTRSALARLRDLHQEHLERPGVLSHELRTPLTVVRGAAELLLDESAGPLNPVQHRFVKTIAENSNQVIEMADDLLAEVRMDSDLFQLRLERVEMRALVRSVVAQMRRFHSAPIRLENHGSPIHMHVDPRLTSQAISNLVNNAARHAGDGTSILVAVSDSDEDVTISVADDGVGMTSEERQRLFVPFATGGSLRPGTGLGMMITQRVARLHGGRLLVDTIQTKGTTFYLTLPRKWTTPTTEGDEHG